MNRVLSLHTVLVLCLLFTFTTHADEKPKTLREVIAELKLEAKASLDGGSWMRESNTYARESKLKFEAKDVIKELSKRQDRNPSIDAYIKWQLLGFTKSADWKDQKPKNLYKLIMSMPPYSPFPQLPRSISAAWAKVYGVKGVSEAEVNQAKLAWEAYKKNIEPKIELANHPIGEYRQQLAKLISDKSSLKSLAKLQDLEDILKAGLNPVAMHGVTRKKGKTNWRPSVYFIGMRRMEDWNPGMEDLIRKKVRSLQGMQVYRMQEPIYKSEYNVWQVGKTLDDPTMNSLKKFEEALDAALELAGK